MPKGVYDRKPLSDIHKKKISDAKKGNKHTENCKHCEISKNRKGGKHKSDCLCGFCTGDAGRKNKGIMRNDEIKEQKRLSMLGNQNAKGNKHIINCRCRGCSLRGTKGEFTLSDKTKEKISQSNYRRWQDSKFREYMLPILSHIQKPTSIENKLFLWLIEVFPIEEIFREYYIKPYRADFAIPELKLCFEADEPYWHQDKEKDQIRDKYIESLGWKVERFESDWLLEHIK